VRYRELGRTGLAVSAIGFGAWGLGGDAYGPIDEDLAKRTLRAAWDAGITFFDTADVYGSGRSERLIGQALRDVRDRIVIATKGGALPHRGFAMPQDFSPAHLRRALEASLRRLQTDYVDLYQLHSPPLAALTEDLRRCLDEFQRAGKVRSVGVSARSPADALVAARDLGFAVVQVNFNLLDQRAIDCGLFAYATEHQVGIVNRTPLCFGFLTGQYGPDATFAADDHRRNWPAEQRARWAEAPRLFAALRSRRLCTMAQLALAFCLAHREVSTVIPGMLHPCEVAENVGALAVESLRPDELAFIREIYGGQRFFLGRPASAALGTHSSS
jgi:aryl-alcohol dehydrogenase-like predicted oxidoreductase